jgi:hypothetical protein
MAEQQHARLMLSDGVSDELRIERSQWVSFEKLHRCFAHPRQEQRVVVRDRSKHTVGLGQARSARDHVTSSN